MTSDEFAVTETCPLRRVALQVDEVEGIGLDLAPSEEGVLVVRVHKFPGQKGLRDNDIIVAIDGHRLDRKACGDENAQYVAFERLHRHGAVAEVLEPWDDPIGVVQFRCPRCRRGYASWQPCLEHLVSVWRTERQAKGLDDADAQVQPPAYELRTWMQRAATAAVGELPRPSKSHATAAPPLSQSMDSSDEEQVLLVPGKPPISGRSPHDIDDDNVTSATAAQTPQAGDAIGERILHDVPFDTKAASSDTLQAHIPVAETKTSHSIASSILTHTSSSHAEVSDKVTASYFQAPCSTSDEKDDLTASTPQSCLHQNSSGTRDLAARAAAARARRTTAISGALAAHGPPMAPSTMDIGDTFGLPSDATAAAQGAPSNMPSDLSHSFRASASFGESKSSALHPASCPTALPLTTLAPCGSGGLGKSLRQALPDPPIAASLPFTHTSAVSSTAVANPRADVGSASLGGVAGLADALADAQLSRCNADAEAWCDEQGPVSLDEILSVFESFAEALSLRPLERQRLNRIICNMISGLPLTTPSGCTNAGNASNTTLSGHANRCSDSKVAQGQPSVRVNAEQYQSQAENQRANINAKVAAAGVRLRRADRSRQATIRRSSCPPGNSALRKNHRTCPSHANNVSMSAKSQHQAALVSHQDKCEAGGDFRALANGATSRVAKRGRARSVSRAARARSSSLRADRGPPPHRTWWARHFNFHRIRAAGAGASVLQVNLAKMGLRDADVRSFVAGLDALLDDLREELAANVGACAIPLRVTLELDLSDNAIGDEGASLLMRWLLARRREMRCRAIDLARNEIGDDAFVWLAEYIRLQHVALEEVNLAENRATEHGMAILLLSIAHHPSDAYPWLNRRGVFVPAWVSLHGNSVKNPGALCKQLCLHGGLRACGVEVEPDRSLRGRSRLCHRLGCVAESRRFDVTPHVHVPGLELATSLAGSSSSTGKGNQLCLWPELLERVERVRAGNGWKPPLELGNLQHNLLTGADILAARLPPGRERPPSMPRREMLFVDEDCGAGIELEATSFGLRVVDVAAFPGQPGLRVGDVIVAVDGWPLSQRSCGSGDDAQNDRFGDRYHHGARLDVLGDFGARSGTRHVPTTSSTGARFRCPGCWEEFPYWAPCLKHLRETGHIPDIAERGRPRENEAACIRRWMGDCAAAARGELERTPEVGDVTRLSGQSQTIPAMLLKAPLEDSLRSTVLLDSFASDAMQCGENHRCFVWIQRDGLELFGEDGDILAEASAEMSDVILFYFPELRVRRNGRSDVEGDSPLVSWVQCMALQCEDEAVTSAMIHASDSDVDSCEEEETGGLAAAGAGTPLNAAAPPFVPRGVAWHVSMLRVLLLCGLPGAGKSSLAEKLRADFGWYVVNQDTLGSRQACMKIVRELLKANDCAKVVVDRCNVNVAQRSMWVQLAAQEFGFGALQLGCVWLATRPEECGRRVMQRFEHKTLPAHASSLRVIRSFADCFEPPLAREGFARIWKIASDLDKEMFWAELRSPVDFQERSTEAYNEELVSPPQLTSLPDALEQKSLLIDSIVYKLEVYFSDAHLTSDAALRSQLECADGGWLQMESLLTQPEIQTDGVTPENVSDALLGHPDLEVKEVGKIHWMRRRASLPALFVQAQTRKPAAVAKEQTTAKTQTATSPIESSPLESFQALRWEGSSGSWVPCNFRELDQNTAAISSTTKADGAMPASTRQLLAPGRRVRIEGVVSRPELNGTVAELGSFDLERGRWRLQIGDRELALKSENLAVEEPHPDHDVSRHEGISNLRDTDAVECDSVPRDADPRDCELDVLPLPTATSSPFEPVMPDARDVGANFWRLPILQEALSDNESEGDVQGGCGTPADDAPQVAADAVVVDSTLGAAEAAGSASFWRVPLPELSDSDDHE